MADFENFAKGPSPCILAMIVHFEYPLEKIRFLRLLRFVFGEAILDASMSSFNNNVPLYLVPIRTSIHTK